MKKKNKILIVCGGGHGVACVYVIEKTNKFKIIGFIDKKKKTKVELCGYKFLGSDQKLKDFRKKTNIAFNGAGHIKNNKLRKKIFYKLKKLDFKVPTIISPHAIIAKTSKLNEGTVIMHGVLINSNSIIGKNCIINSKALLEHDVIIEDHCHISTGVVVNGNTIIGKNSFIGSGSVIGNGVKIGKNCIVSAGSTVIKDLANDTLFKKK